MLRPKPKAPRSPGKGPRKDFPAHRKWVRNHACAVPDCEELQIEAAHCRLGLPAGQQAGLGQKPHDMWCIPLCSTHHRIQHTFGEATFQILCGVNMIEVAKECARLSPFRKMWETEE